MIFARYKGEPTDSFSKGKTYVASPEIDDGETVGFGSMSIVADDGNLLCVNPSAGLFEFLNEVYAVVVEPNVCEWEVGEVITVTDATPDGMFKTSEGLSSDEHFVILDRTNIFPGMVVMDCSTGEWVPVRRVDESLWVMVNGGDVMRSPEEFVFAVSNGDILVDPVAVCISDVGMEGSLKAGGQYRIQRILDGMWTVLGEEGKPVTAFATRFRMG